jgi:hypothetical protein
MSEVKVGQKFVILSDKYVVVGFESRPGQKNKRNINGLPNGSSILFKPASGGYKRYPLEISKFKKLLDEGLIRIA